MKRFSQCICLFLVCIMVLTIPVAAEGRSLNASNYFGYTSAYLSGSSATQFKVCFEVTAVDEMDELGASTIKVQRLENGDWKTVHTRTKESYSGMIARGTGDHNYNFTYYGTSGYQYRAYVEFYAKKDNGTAYYDYYTETIP